MPSKSARATSASSAVTAEDVDAEIDALLAKIPDKYGGNGSPSSAAGRARSGSKGHNKSQWQCEPITLVVSALLLVAVTVLVYLSLSPKPFWAFKELQGEWVIDAQGSASRRMAFLALDDPVMIVCEAPAILAKQRPMKPTVSNTVEGEPIVATAEDDSGAQAGRHEAEDKIVGNLVDTSCRFSVGPFALDRSDMHFTSVRANTMVWTWTGACHDDDAPAISGVKSAASPDARPPMCSISVHRKRLLFTIYSADGQVYSYTLTRAETLTGGDSSATSWTAFWNEKGRFMFALVVVVVVLKGFQYALTPKQDMSQRLAQHRLARQKSAAAQLARMERDDAATRQ